MTKKQNLSLFFDSLALQKMVYHVNNTSLFHFFCNNNPIVEKNNRLYFVLHHPFAKFAGNFVQNHGLILFYFHDYSV
jgi:hypothetical protein